MIQKNQQSKILIEIMKDFFWGMKGDMYSCVIYSTQCNSRGQIIAAQIKVIKNKGQEDNVYISYSKGVENKLHENKKYA